MHKRVNPLVYAQLNTG